MPKDSRRSSSAVLPRACVNCQKRKTRCLRVGSDSGSCSYCLRKGKTCSFDSPPDRTPLTRKNLDAAEDRNTQLRSLLRSLNPGIDIETALEHLGAEDAALSPSHTANNDLTPDSYEWHEGSLSPELVTPDRSNAVTTDGMATLQTDDSGYLGSSSGSRILEEINPTISKVARQKLRPRQQRRLYRPRAQQIEAPSLMNTYAVNELIDAYFILYNSHFPVLHEKTFRDRVAAGQQHTAPLSPWRVTYYMVLAIGHWASNKESEHIQSHYYTAARSSLSLQMLESGTVETVQAFLLMGNYLQKRDRTNTGYNFIGLAYRMAIGLGLHREPSSLEDTIGHERRRQLFWTIYCVESGFNITTGRPPTIVDGFMDIRLPLNIDDKALSLTSTVPTEVDYPTTYSAIIAQARLAKIADAIYHEFLLAKTAGSKIEYRMAESMERDLVNWYRDLPRYFTVPDIPSWFRGPRSVVLWKEQNLRILLWRGSQAHHSFLPTKMVAEEKCMYVAMDSIHEISAFCITFEENLYPSLTWYATYFLLQATLVLVAGFLDKNAQGQAEALELHHSIFKSRNCLRMLASRNKSASRYLEMLDIICNQFPPPSVDLELDQDPYSLQHIPTEDSFAAPMGNIAQDPQNFVPLPSENDFVIPGESQFSLNEDDNNTDPNFRMLINQVSHDFMGSMPLDLLFNDWANFPS